MEPTAPLRPLVVAARVAGALDEDGIPYAIGGALALGVWGAQRATNDVDLSVFVGEPELPRVLDALERAGLIVDRAEAARDTTRIGLFKARAGKTIVDVFLSGHPQYDDMKRRRVAITEPTSGQALYFISPEDLCIHKLIFGRPKDVTDLERLLAVRPTLDLAYVRAWLVKMLPAGDRRLDVLDDLERRFRP